MTVHDSRGSYLIFFQRAAGGDRERDAEKRKIRHMIRAVLRKRGVRRTDLPGAAESALQPLALSRAAGARENWAFVQRWAGIEYCMNRTWWVARGRADGPEKSDASGRRSTCAIFTGFSGIGTWGRSDAYKTAAGGKRARSGVERTGCGFLGAV